MKPLGLLILLSTWAFVSGGCGSGNLTTGSTQFDLPAVIEGTTVKAKHRDGDEACGQSGPTVLYRIDPEQKSRIAVRFRAGGDLEAMVCVMQESPTEPTGMKRASADERGNASFDFDGNVGATYFLAVIQDPKSEPGAFTMNVEALPNPGNDDRADATPVVSVPLTLEGTTAGATVDDQDPGCLPGTPSVWYRMGSLRTSRMVVSLQAEPGTRTAVCAMQKVRSHLRGVGADNTDDRGRASLAFKSEAGETYFVAVSRPTAKSGQFALTVQRPDEPPTLPGEALRGVNGRGRLDPLANPQDSWAVKMEKGKTYRLTLVTTPEECVSVAVFSLRVRSFRTGVVAAEFDCATTEFFAPGPDGGGTYPVLLTAGGSATAYQLFVSPVEPDDSGPGVVLESGARVVGYVSAADPLDLYRFDVPGTSSVEFQLASKRDIDVELKNSDGHTIGTLQPNDTVARVLETGTYYLAVTPDEHGSRYTLALIVRFLTATYLTVDGASSVTVGSEEAVSLQTTTVPYPGPGATEVQADFFDVATETWVFRQLWEVSPGSAISFTPDAVGRWRVRATFFANDVASMSRTRYCTITVSTVRG